MALDAARNRPPAHTLAFGMAWPASEEFQKWKETALRDLPEVTAKVVELTGKAAYIANHLYEVEGLSTRAPEPEKIEAYAFVYAIQEHIEKYERVEVTPEEEEREAAIRRHLLHVKKTFSRARDATATLRRLYQQAHSDLHNPQGVPSPWVLWTNKVTATCDKYIAACAELIEVIDKPIEPFNTKKETFLYWRFGLLSYPGKWPDMYVLARAWGLTQSSSVANFTQIVTRRNR